MELGTAPTSRQGRMPRPSLLQLSSSRRVKTLVSHWQDLDQENNAPNAKPIRFVQDESEDESSWGDLKEGVSVRPLPPPRSPRPLSAEGGLLSVTTAPQNRKRRRQTLGPLEEEFAPLVVPSPTGKRKRSPSDEWEDEPLEDTNKRTSSPAKRQKLTAHKELAKPAGSPLVVSRRKKKPVTSPGQLLRQSQEKERIAKLREALREVYTTEVTYWKSLLQMQSVFLFGAQPLVPPKQLAAIFSNSGDVLIHSQNLMMALREIEMPLEAQETSHSPFTSECLRDAASLMASRFQDILPSSVEAYKAYCCGYEAAHTALLAADSPESKFHDFLRATQRQQVLNLYDSLILPVQRLPRYQILLQAIHKYLSNDEEAADVLEQVSDAQQLVISMNVAVDEAIRLCENAKHMKAAAALFQPEYADFFSATQRDLIKQGHLSGHPNGHYLARDGAPFPGPAAVPTADDPARFLLVMFNDQIILARDEASSRHRAGLLVIQHYFGFESTYLLDGTTATGAPCLQLVNPKYGFSFYPRSKSELISWKGSFRKALNTLVESSPALPLLRDKVELKQSEETGQWHAELSVQKFCSLRKTQRKNSFGSIRSVCSPPSPSPVRKLASATATLASPVPQGDFSERDKQKTFSPLRLLSPKRLGTGYRKRQNWKTLQAFPIAEEQEDVAELVVSPPRPSITHQTSGRGLPLTAMRSFDGREVSDLARPKSKRAKKRFSLSHFSDAADLIQP